MLQLAALLPFLASAQAFFILSQPVLLNTRLDPIVDPGTISGHVHTIAGGSNFDKYMTYESALSSTCTTAPITVDKSNYWIPQLYYYNPQTTGFQAIPAAYVNTYYLPRKGTNDTIRAFPDGLRMISGDPERRTFDPKDVYDQAISYVCLDYNGKHQGDPAWAQRNDFFEHNCPDGLRVQVNFPTCWNGKDIDSADHRSHMAWPIGASNNGGGNCPASHPVKVVQLFYEFIFEVQKFPFNSVGPTWVWANGDASGYGLHADFLSGWPRLVNGTNVLQRAIDECNDNDGVGGNLEACPPFAGLINRAQASGCRPQNPLVAEDIGYGHEIPFLPSDNPLWVGDIEKPSRANYTEDDPEYADPRSVLPADWNYVGCIREANSGRALSAFSMSVTGMTRSLCATECGKRGYPLSGTEYGRECYCDFAMQNGASNTTILPVERCNIPCAANKYENCGGSGTLSLYRNPTLFALPVAATNPTVPAGVEGWFRKERNCVAEPSGRRALTGYNTANGQMSAVACITLCRARGFAFAGTEWSSECYCGSSVDSGSSEASSADCDRPCSGKPDEMCGGAQRLSMYFTNTTAPVKAALPADWEAVGCWNGQATSGRALTGPLVSNSSMSNTVCIMECASKGFTYAGTEYGRECRCGNELAVGSAQVPASDCGTVCAGDPSQICGNGNRMTTFKYTGKPAPAPVAAPLPQDWTATGCWNSQTPSGRTFTGYFVSNRSMTSDMCMLECQSRGFALAGSEYGMECRCSQEFPAGSTQVNVGECSTPCAGDSKQLCGGGNRMTTFKWSGKPAPTPAPVAAPLPLDWTAAGCWNAQAASGRAFTGAFVSNTSITNDICMMECQAKGFPLAGLEYGRECRCAMEYAVGSSQVAASDCSMPCAGDKTQICGAGNRMTVFKYTAKAATPAPSSTTTSPAPAATSASAWAYRGCYTDGNPRSVPNGGYKSQGNMTRALCLAFAEEKGHSWAALVYGRECFTGPLLNDKSTSTPDSECNFVCTGGQATGEKCGGNNRASVFQLTGKAAPATSITAPSYIGCFTDRSNRQLNGTSVFGDSKMTNELCTDNCGKKGFAFAGTSYGSECMCGNSINRSDNVTISKPTGCGMACAGAADQKCGASWQLTVYLTGQGTPTYFEQAAKRDLGGSRVARMARRAGWQ